jgi:hypothetical protein
MHGFRVYRFTMTSPLVLSLLALALCGYGRAFPEHLRGGDEGWQAHLFQLLMSAQVGVIAVFLALTWRLQRWRPALPALVLQVALFGLAVAAVPTLGR